MTQQIFRTFGVLAAIGLLLLAGCSSSPETTSLPPENIAKTATGRVTLSVQFPQAALQKALMDERTTAIQIVINDSSYNMLADILLTPDASGMATQTLEVPTGTAYFTAWAYAELPDLYDPSITTEQEIEMISTAGDIIEGDNTVILTFLSGDWQFVDANDNPITMSVGGTGYAVSLAGFSLSSGYMGMNDYPYYAKAGTIDPSKPSGSGDYSIQWYQGTTNDAFGPQIWADQRSQFISGGANATNFGSEFLNLTEPTRSSLYDNNEKAGDRVVFVFNYDSGDDSTTLNSQGQDVSSLLDDEATSRVIDSSTLAGNLLEMTFDGSSRTLQQSQIDCQPYWNSSPASARAAAVKASIEQSPAKAAIGDGVLLLDSFTLSFDECESGQDVNNYSIGDLYRVTETYSNLVTREYRAKGSQLFSKFSPSLLGGWVPDYYSSTYQLAVTFLDATHYIYAEDGVAETDPTSGAITGGPGMEYGTYSFDASSNVMTFTPSYDTSGDWGPAEGTGTGTINLQLTGSNQLLIHSTDPAAPFSYYLNRVTSSYEPIVGSWKFGNETSGMQVITFLPYGEYLVASFSPNNTTLNGMEHGTYFTDGTNALAGNITFTGISSTLPASGTDDVVAAPGQTVSLPAVLTADGNSIVFDSTTTFTRVK